VAFFSPVQLFDKVKTEHPGVAENKIIPLFGNLSEIRLGISDDDYSLLVSNVSIVFHVAATVRFDEPIRDAIIKNVRGTREVVGLAAQMKNLMVSKNCPVIYIVYNNPNPKCLNSRKNNTSRPSSEIKTKARASGFGNVIL